MPPFAVVERFDISGDHARDFFAGGVVGAMHFLHFHRMPETFHRRIVPRGQASRS